MPCERSDGQKVFDEVELREHPGLRGHEVIGGRHVVAQAMDQGE